MKNKDKASQNIYRPQYSHV